MRLLSHATLLHLIELLGGDGAEVRSVDVLVEGFEVVSFEAFPDGFDGGDVALVCGVGGGGCWGDGLPTLGLGGLCPAQFLFSLAAGSPLLFVFALAVLGYFLFLLRIGTSALLLLTLNQKIPGTCGL